ncbi:hypothetical protein [uncultured Hoeflea sp.]|uniref:hypothetical protein n=1 Tax=uncultured Hoeflea sp. TaxID=538666 RepID=UPI0026194339|nr:hypothetical protein [uncultured Hoeflea sp.]
MSMFSFPADMNMNEMMKPMTAMTDLSKAADMQVAPLMVYPLGAAAAATAVGFGMAGQMTGLMMGAMQAAMQSQTSALGAKPDLSWLVPTLAEDLAPEELDEAPVAESKPKAAKAKTPAARKPAAKTADIVELKPAAKAAEAAIVEKPSAKAADKTPAVAKTAAAKPKSTARSSTAKPATPKAEAKASKAPASETGAKAAKTPKPAEAAKGSAVAAVEKLKSDAETAAAVATEAASTVAVKQAKPAAALEPEDYRRPSEIEKPGTPDDLKLISGVGPKLEQVLNGLGVWTFAQIADWKAEEIAWVDDYLQFKGRIDRDDWISQARALAKGGITA